MRPESRPSEVDHFAKTLPNPLKLLIRAAPNLLRAGAFGLTSAHLGSSRFIFLVCLSFPLFNFTKFYFGWSDAVGWSAASCRYVSSSGSPKWSDESCANLVCFPNFFYTKLPERWVSCLIAALSRLCSSRASIFAACLVTLLATSSLYLTYFLMAFFNSAASFAFNFSSKSRCFFASASSLAALMSPASLTLAALSASAAA